MQKQITAKVTGLIKNEKYKIVANMGWNEEEKYYPRKSRIFYGTGEEAEAFKENWIFELTYIDDHQRLLDEFGALVPGLDEFYKFGPEIIDKLGKGYSLYDAWVLLNKDAAPQEEQSSETVGEWLDFWLENDAKLLLEWEQNTERRAKGIIKNNIKPFIGDKILVKLSPDDVIGLYKKLSVDGGRHKKPLSQRSIRYVHTILNQSLNQAIVRKKITENPAKGLTPALKKEKAYKKWVVLDEEELPAFLFEIQRERDYFLIFAAAYTGARESELLGMPWENFLADDCVFRIDRALHKTYEETEEDKFEFRDNTKNESSTRVIGISKTLVFMMNLHREFQKARGIPTGPKDLIFTEPDGSPIDADNLSARYRKLAKRHRHKGMRFHDLRHTHATILLTDGAYINEVAERLGHASVRTTLGIYGHVLPKRRHSLADRFDELTNGNTELRKKPKVNVAVRLPKKQRRIVRMKNIKSKNGIKLARGLDLSEKIP